MKAGRIRENRGWDSWVPIQKLKSREEHLLLKSSSWFKMFMMIKKKKKSEAVTEPLKTQNCKCGISHKHVFYVICKYLLLIHSAYLEC